MAKTIRERYLEQIYNQFPNLRQLTTATEQMVDWFLDNRKDFEKTMKALEKDASKQPAVDKPREVIVECITKKEATDEDQKDAVPHSALEQAGGRATVEVLADDS